VSAFPSFAVPGQVALVTGGARGLGRAIALALAEAGADIALGLRDLAADGGVPQEIEKLGHRVLPLQMDVRDTGQVSEAAAAAAAHFGRLDILVNNAGGGVMGRAEDIAEDDFDAVMSVNVKGPISPARRSAGS